MKKANELQQVLDMLKDAPDEQVLFASQKNPEVFAILVARYEAAFMRKALSIVYQKEDAEEVVQDTFTRMYVYASRYTSQEGASFSSWAYTILTRLAFTRYQKLKTKRARTLELDPEAYERLPDEEPFIDKLSMTNEVLIALARIPESAARVLRLQFLEGKSQEEIAKQEDTSVASVKTRVHRAKKLLREAVIATNPYDHH